MYRSGLALAGAQMSLDDWTRGLTPPTESDGIVTAAEASALQLSGDALYVGIGLAFADEVICV